MDTGEGLGLGLHNLTIRISRWSTCSTVIQGMVNSPYRDNASQKILVKYYIASLGRIIKKDVSTLFLVWYRVSFDNIHSIIWGHTQPYASSRPI